jgi:flavin-binding protein dodecin
MFGFRVVGPHIRQAAQSGKLECKEADAMSVARVTELSAISETGFEDAINQAVARATKTLRGVEGAWVKDMNVMIENGNITGYKVNVEITFMLEE